MLQVSLLRKLFEQALGTEGAKQVDINTIDQRISEWAGQARQVFWVQWFESDTDPRHAVPFLLDQLGQRAGSQSFQGYSIDWWALNPPNQAGGQQFLANTRYLYRPYTGNTVFLRLRYFW